MWHAGWFGLLKLNVQTVCLYVACRVVWFVETENVQTVRCTSHEQSLAALIHAYLLLSPHILSHCISMNVFPLCCSVHCMQEI